MGETQSYLWDPDPILCTEDKPEATAPTGLQTPTASGPAGVHVVAEPGLDVPEGAALNLSCQLPGGPGLMGNSTFTWFWNGRRLHTEPVPTVAFTHVARDQAGMYHCQAELPTGATASAPVTLRVLCECHILDIFPPPQSPHISHACFRSSSSSVCKIQGLHSNGVLGQRIPTDWCVILCLPALVSLSIKCQSPLLVRSAGGRACRMPGAQ